MREVFINFFEVKKKNIYIYIYIKRNEKIIIKKECVPALSIVIGFRHSYMGVNFTPYIYR